MRFPGHPEHSTVTWADFSQMNIIQALLPCFSYSKNYKVKGLFSEKFIKGKRLVADGAHVEEGHEQR